MSWIALSLNATHEAVDWIATLLAKTDAPVEVQIVPFATSEAAAGLDELDELDELDSEWAWTVWIYLPAQARSHAAAIDQLLAPLYRTGLTSELQMDAVETQPSDRPMQKPHRIGQRFVVVPPRASVPLAIEDIPLQIGTTRSFGSGLHPATMLTLRLLERHVLPGMQALDLGSGSGILSVALAKLGAQVFAIDNDPIAVQATQSTVQQNGVAAQVTVQHGSLGSGSNLGHWMGGESIAAVPTLAAPEACDLVVANILARVHIALAQEYQTALQKTGGLLITAGFTTEYEDTIVSALAAVGFAAVDTERLEDWVAIVHRLT